MEIINATDGYKLGHHRMYPEGTEQVYSNWTPRSNKYFPEATEGSVVFGIQYLIKKYLIDEFNQNFFGLPKEKAVEMFYRRVHNFVGIESVGYKHIEALYDLGYLPIRIKALPEGSVCPIRVPMMTITNTKSEFFWLTNYLETLISCTLWMPCTSATRARLYKKELKRHAVHTGGDYSCVIELLKECSLLGFEMILFTTDEDDYKIMAKQTICMRLGIANITSNTLSAPNISSSIFSKSKKPYYNILLDDRAGLEESYEILKYVVDEIKLNQQGNQ